MASGELGPWLEKLGRLAGHWLERAEDRLERVRMRSRPPAGEGLLAREAAHWSRGPSFRVMIWQDHPLVRAYINRRVSGAPGVNWLAWFGRSFGVGFERALDLGCGFGDLEEHALSLGLARSFHAIDISEPALAVARSRLAGRPVSFELADLNRVSLPASAYDAVFAASSLHHLTNLEGLLDEVEKSLRPGGFLVFDEFVGPSRFQWTEKQLAVVNEILAALPGRFKKRLRLGFGRKRRVRRAPLDGSGLDSPFEAARSSEILLLAEERFELAARRDYGGALLHPLLEGIAGNFVPGRGPDDKLLGELCELELELERAGALGSDFTVVAARKR